MSVFAVVGGTGTVGRHVVAVLRNSGAEARVLSRRSSEHRVDLVSGVGLDSALAGCDVVIDVSNGSPRHPERVTVDGMQRLTEAAARAGIGHLVCVSIVGIERVPTRYYRAKLAQERVVRDGQVPWSIVRSTQFHELAAGAFETFARWRISPRSDARVQPIAALEAGRVVAEAAHRPPSLQTLTVAGPEVHDVSALARVWAEHHHRRGVPLRIPLTARVRRPLKAGALTCAAPDIWGRTPFSAWLSTRI